MRSPEALLEPSFEASKNFNFEYKEHSKRNHPNNLPRSQRSLESSSKVSRNLNKPQIGKTLWIQASKAPKNFHHKPSNMKNIRSRIIQTTCLNLKVHWNQAQKPSRNLNKPQIGEALWIQASKAPKNFHHKSSNTKNIRSRILQTTCINLKVHWNQAQKP